MSVQIVKSNFLKLQQLAQGNLLVRLCREIKGNDFKVYNIIRSESVGTEFHLLSKQLLNSKIQSLDPTKSLTPYIKYIPMLASSASLRMVEAYHLVCGISNYPGSDPNPRFIDKSGLERKIKIDGRSLSDRAETCLAADGGIETLYPILEEIPVSAIKAGGQLTPTVRDPNLGKIDLLDGEDPIEDGILVSVAYSAIKHCVVNILDSGGKVVAVLASKELLDYLTANS